MKYTITMFKTYFLALIETLKSGAVAAFSVFSAFIAPIGDLLFFITLLIIADFFTGYVAAKYRGQKRESSKMAKSIYKFIFYLVAILMAHMFDSHFKQLFNPHLLAVVADNESIETLSQFKFLAALSIIVIARELKSIDENWEAIFKWNFTSSAVAIYNKLISILTLLKNKK